MNLALIDPFQLAQDSPEALTHDLREFPTPGYRNRPISTPSIPAFSAPFSKCARTDQVKGLDMLRHSDLVAKATIWRRDESMARLSSGTCNVWPSPVTDFADHRQGYGDHGRRHEATWTFSTNPITEVCPVLHIQIMYKWRLLLAKA